MGMAGKRNVLMVAVKANMVILDLLKETFSVGRE
jgi:hypothetical protein